ncbi:hypothetical protein SDC9_200868 [bioreactor metagenome]|uniref:Uncharacterized protein n=1 Tax=bioreactor metagenome TaxID=1076179 RepID=A0A645IXV0_9ZZZZ
MSGTPQGLFPMKSPASAGEPDKAMCSGWTAMSQPIRKEKRSAVRIPLFLPAAPQPPNTCRRVSTVIEREDNSHESNDFPVFPAVRGIASGGHSIHADQRLHSGDGRGKKPERKGNPVFLRGPVEVRHVPEFSALLDRPSALLGSRHSSSGTQVRLHDPPEFYDRRRSAPEI